MLSQRTATATELAAGKPSGPGGHSTKPLSAEAFPQLNLHQCKPKSGCENARARGASVCYHHLHKGSLGPRPSTRSCSAQTCAYTTAALTGFLMQLSQIWWEQTGTALPALRTCHRSGFGGHRRGRAHHRGRGTACTGWKKNCPQPFGPSYRNAVQVNNFCQLSVDI